MKVKIEPLREEHALISWRWRNDPSVWELTGGRPDRFITPEIETEWIKKAIRNQDQKRYAILADSVYVGNVQLTDIKDESGEFHIFIGDKSYWGKGIAIAATALMLKCAFEEYKLQKVHLWVNKKNYSAIKVYEKCGFRLVGEDDVGLKMEVKNAEC